MYANLPCRALAAISYNVWIVDSPIVPRIWAIERRQACAPACDIQSAKACKQSPPPPIPIQALRKQR